MLWDFECVTEISNCGSFWIQRAKLFKDGFVLLEDKTTTTTDYLTEFIHDNFEMIEGSIPTLKPFLEANNMIPIKRVQRMGAQK